MSARDARLPIPVTILTGFLGSGKTTLLNNLLRRPELEGAAVIINEFGEVGLDHLLIESTEERYALLGNGCVCCTVRGDLVETLLRLLDRSRAGALPGFRRVVIETTGLADPAPILHTLAVEPELCRAFRIDAVVTTVDAVNGRATLAAYPEAVKQAAVADRLLLTKTDIAPSLTAERLRRELSALNPTAGMVECRDGALDPGAILGTALLDPSAPAAEIAAWFRKAADRATRYEVRAAAANRGDAVHDRPGPGLRYAGAPHDGTIRSHALVVSDPVSWPAFSQWLDYLAMLKGEDLLRFKGLVHIAEHPDQPLVVHGVQHVFHPPRKLDAWPSEDRRTRLIFIVRNIPRGVIETTLIKYAGVDATRPYRGAA